MGAALTTGRRPRRRGLAAAVGGPGKTIWRPEDNRGRRDPGGGGARIGGVVLGGDSQGLGIARSLGAHGVPVCVIDDEPSIARASRYVQHAVRVPDMRTEDGLLDALAVARARHGLAGWVLYPTRDENVAAIAAHRDELASHFRVPTPGLDSVRYPVGQAGDLSAGRAARDRDAADVVPAHRGRPRPRSRLPGRWWSSRR